MKTKADVEAAFRADLQALLAKYDAELEAKDHYQGYAECGEDIRMTVTIPAIYSATNDCEREWTEIDLGSWQFATQDTPNVRDAGPTPYSGRTTRRDEG